MVENHLSNKNVIQKLCDENENECGLIRQFEQSNTLIRDQLAIEQTKIVEARALIKMLKQELMHV